MALTGAFGPLRTLTRTVSRLSGGAWRPALSRALADRALELVHAQFDRGRDPYGQLWAPLKSRRGRPLLNTGTLRLSFEVASGALGFRLRSKHPGARLHNYGGVVVPKNARALAFKVGGTRGGRGKGARWVFARRVVIPRRQILPSGDRLGGAWSNALRATALAWLLRQASGRP